jgi:hypothetical protein
MCTTLTPQQLECIFARSNANIIMNYFLNNKCPAFEFTHKGFMMWFHPNSPFVSFYYLPSCLPLLNSSWFPPQWSVYLIFLIIYFCILWCAEVHCAIYIGHYNVSNVSYMNWPPQPFSFISPSPDSWKSFNRYTFYIFLHVYTFYCTVFNLLHHFATPPVSNWCQSSPLGRDFSAFLFSEFEGEKRMKIKRNTWHLA